MAAQIPRLIAVLLVSGCGVGGGAPSLSVVCPTVLPTVNATEWPDTPTSLVELQTAYLQGKAAYDDLVDQRRETEAAWRHCKKLVN